MTNTILDTKLETVGIHDVATKRKLLTLYLLRRGSCKLRNGSIKRETY